MFRDASVLVAIVIDAPELDMVSQPCQVPNMEERVIVQQARGALGPRGIPGVL